MTGDSSEPAGQPRRSALDGPAGRLGALGVLLGVLAALAAIHWDDFFPPPQAEVAADDPVALCLAGRVSDIDRMHADGTISAAQAELFKSRAAALCEAQAGGGQGTGQGGLPDLPRE